MQDDDLLANVTEVAGNKVLPPCVITGRLGAGGMGAVYRAFHLNLKCDVALKVLKPQLVDDDPTLVERFEREGRAANKINHQNVIRVYDVCESNGLNYIIMELVVGETGRQRVKRKGALGIGEALQITYESALGLGEAHSLGIVHRDIKPDNLLISTEGKVKVADLGLAKASLGGGNSLMSSPNQIMGTPAYMPPEQWESSSSPATDVWALGATLWFLLAGRDAISDPDNIPARMMKKILLQAFPDLRAVRPDVPDDVMALIAKATAKEGSDRFLDGADMAEAIAQLTTKRTPLRDRSAPSPEAQTIVSKTPIIKDLDKVRQYLREDALTRMQTPGKLREAMETGAQKRPGADAKAEAAKGESVPPAGGTLVQSKGPKGPVVGDSTEEFEGPKGSGTQRTAPPKAGVRWGLVAVVLLVAAGGGGALWALTRPDPQLEASLFADAESKAEQGKYDEAIAAMRAVFNKQPKLRTKARDEQLAGYYQRAVGELEKQDRWKTALVHLQEAIAEKPVQELQDLREVVYGRLKAVAEKKLVKKSPTAEAAVKPTGDVQFEGQLAFDAVKQLELAGVPVTILANGSFTCTVKPPSKDVTVLVTLIDDKQLSLDPWRLNFAEERRVLSFLAGTKPSGVSVDDAYLTERETIRIDGGIEEPNARFLVGDKEVVPELYTNGSFRLQIPVEEGASNVTLIARRDGFADATMTFKVLRITKLPTIAFAPETPKETDKAEIAVSVSVGPWAKLVDVRVGSGEYQVLKQVDATKPIWSGSVKLGKGANQLEARVTNLVNKSANAQFSITYNAPPPPKPASITLATLTRGNDVPVKLLRDKEELVYLTKNNPDATLDLEVSGQNVKVRISGIDVPLTNNLGSVRLRDFAKEGERVDLLIFATNDPTSPADSRKVVLVKDTTLPQVAITTAQAPVQKDAALKLEGTCSDAIGIDKLELDDGGRKREIPVVDGRWNVELAQPQTVRIVTLVATDKAGNRSEPKSRAIELASETNSAGTNTNVGPATTPSSITAKAFPGFTFVGSAATKGGYPVEIDHDATKIRLVALDPNDAGKPLYVAVDKTTGAQWDGDGDNAPKGSVTGKQIHFTWRTGRGNLLRLPTVDEWNRIKAARNPSIKNVGTGKREWLLPANPGATTSWPLSDDDSYNSGESLPGIGFRTVYKAP